MFAVLYSMASDATDDSVLSRLKSNGTQNCAIEVDANILEI